MAITTLNNMDNETFQDFERHLVAFVRFWTTNQIQIAQRSDNEYLIKAAGKVEGLDTTRTFPAWDVAAKHVAAVALGYKGTQAA